MARSRDCHTETSDARNVTQQVGPGDVVMRDELPIAESIPTAESLVDAESSIVLAEAVAERSQMEAAELGDSSSEASQAQTDETRELEGELWHAIPVVLPSSLGTESNDGGMAVGAVCAGESARDSSDPSFSEQGFSEQVVAELVIDSARHRDLVSARVADSTAERSWPFRLARLLGRASEVAWGTISLWVLLAVVSGVPGLQILALGYLLEVSGRIGKSGRWQDCVPGYRLAARLGSVALGTAMCLLPIAYLGTLVQAAEWIDPAGEAVTRLKVGRLLVTVVLVPHLLAAWFCGGKLRYFFWPLLAPGQLAIWSLRWVLATPPLGSLLDATLGRVWPSLARDLRSVVPLTDFFVPMILAKHLWYGTLWRTMRDGFWEMLVRLQLPALFWLGARGLLGSVGWLFLPTLALIGGTVFPDGPAVLSGTLGVVLLALVCLYLPIAQTHFAVERRLWVMFDLGAIRDLVARSPLRHSLAMGIVLASAVPLYLFKIEMVDQGLWWALGLVFIVFSLPARWMTGWAYRRSLSRSKRTWCLWRWPIRMLAWGAAVAFAIFVSVTRFTSWGGAAGLFEQHAFLVPAPFTKFF